MRVLGHALRMLLILAVIAVAAWWGWPRLVLEMSKLRGTEPIEGAKSTISYILPENDWLEFPVDRRSQIIRVLSTANTLRTQLALAEPGTSYALRYQLLDRAGRVLAEQTHHHGTDIARGIDLETGEFSPTLFYRDPTIVPLRSQRLLIGRELSDKVTRLRLQLAMHDPSISDVVVRVHVRAQVRAGALNRKDARLWPRLRHQQRELLAGASVYGQYLLSDEEKETLIKLSWKPMGTTGIEAQDYATRRLYFVHTADDTEVVASGLPTGMFVRGGLRAVVPVPPRPVPVTLAFETSSVDTTDADPNITIEYYGKHNAHQRYTLPPGIMTWEASLDGGWLEVSAASIVTVRAFLADGNGQEITPRARHLRTFVAAPGKPLEYWIDHIGEHDTAFRIDLRTRDGAESPTAASVRYALLDAAGQVVAQGRLRTDDTISYYDRAAGDAETRLSESTRYFFRLPAQVTRLRLSSDDGEALISGYSRPPDLAHELVVPRDYIPFIRQHSDNPPPPMWFLVNPVHSNDLIRTQRSMVLTVQTPPPKYNPQIAAGDYEWIDYTPDGAWLGRHLLNPRESGTPVNARARSVVFRRIDAGIVTTLQLHGDAQTRRITPTLIFVREQTAPFHLTVSLDNREVLNEELAGRRGELRLPAVTTGPHLLQITSSANAQWLINYAGGDGTAFTRRLAYRMGGAGLRFQYLKQSHERETLSVRVQVPRHDPAPLGVTTSIDTGRPSKTDYGPRSDYTLLQRRFIVQSDLDTTPVAVLGTSNEWADQGATFYVPFGADLPPGPYTVHLQPEDGREAYATLYRILPGARPRHRYFRELATRETQELP